MPQQRPTPPTKQTQGPRLDTRLFSAVTHSHPLFFFFLMIGPPPISTLFPYTTLFRSCYSQPAFRSAKNECATGTKIKRHGEETITYRRGEIRLDGEPAVARWQIVDRERKVIRPIQIGRAHV